MNRYKTDENQQRIDSRLKLVSELNLLEAEKLRVLQLCESKGNFKVVTRLPNIKLWIIWKFWQREFHSPVVLTIEKSMNWISLFNFIYFLDGMGQQISALGEDEVRELAISCITAKFSPFIKTDLDMDFIINSSADLIEQLDKLLDESTTNIVLDWFNAKLLEFSNLTNALQERLIMFIKNRTDLRRKLFDYERNYKSYNDLYQFEKIRIFLRGNLTLTRALPAEPLTINNIFFDGNYQDLLIASIPVISELSMKRQFYTFNEIAETIRNQDKLEVSGFYNFAPLIDLIMMLPKDIEEEITNFLDQIVHQLDNVTREQIQDSVQLVSDRWLEHNGFPSMDDTRVLFFWQLLTTRPKWITEETVHSVIKMSKKLPDKLYDTFIIDLIRSTKLKPDFEIPYWWEIFIFSTAAEASDRKLKLTTEEYESFINSALTSRYIKRDFQARDKLSKIIATLTSIKLFSHLQKSINLILEQQDEQDAHHRRNMNAAIAKIIERVEIKTGRKFFIDVEAW